MQSHHWRYAIPALILGVIAVFLYRGFGIDSKRALAEVSALKGVVPGVASTYREVQGLSPTARDRERKAAILREIFAANLELARLRRVRAEVAEPELVPAAT